MQRSESANIIAMTEGGRPWENAPIWLDDKSINEIVFCEEFLSEHRIICVNDHFIGIDGVIEDRTIDNLIYEKLKPHIQKAVASKVKQLEQALKLEAHSEEIVPDMNEIHLLNGTLNAKTGEFTHEKKFCFGRINNSYDPDAPKPEKFLAFLSELPQERLAVFQGLAQGAAFFDHDDPDGDGSEEKDGADDLADDIAFFECVKQAVGGEKRRKGRDNAEKHGRSLFLRKKS